MKAAAPKPVLLFDGDCGFCRLWVGRWRHVTGESVDYEPSQSAGKRFPKIPRAAFAEAVYLVEPDGRVSRGAEAAFRTLAYGGGVHRAWRALYEGLPPFRAVSERVYALVAARRPLFSRLTKLLWGSPLPAPIDGTRRAVLAGLGLCYLVAFVSLGVQLRGLIGGEGLLPAARLLQAARAQLGAERYWFLPTLAWFASSDAALVGFCAAGGLAALGLILDVAVGPCALAAWVLYLSLCSVGGDFLSFQWDILLLETGLIAVFLAPWSLRRADRTAPSRGALWLLRLLLFKLMLESGLVKLASGDASWRDLTALTYHYWTQPLPTPAAWYFARLPATLQKASCLVMFAVELGAPWLLLAPRRPRALGASAIAGLMLLIALTGNYGFFNLLALVLCVAALDDDWAPLARLAPATARRAPSPLRGRALAGFAAVWLAVSGVQLGSIAGLRPPLAGAWSLLLVALEPLRSINRYGLFAVMTTRRDEIAVEVSADGHEWKEWPFRWKPGDPRRAPPWVAPHMPRLDWQMWFAALGAPSQWFNNLLYRLLQGDPAVESLLGPSPLGGVKPAYARAALWSTRFTTPEESRADGAWWRRERGGLYFPVVSLRAGAASPEETPPSD